MGFHSAFNGMERLSLIHRDAEVGHTKPGVQTLIIGSDIMKKKATGTPETFSLRVKVAGNIWSRGWGLLGRKELKIDQGLWIKPCASVHTLLMRFPVDLIYLDAENQVVKTQSRVQPFKFSAGNSQTHSVLEMSEGFIVRNHWVVGDKLEIVPVGKKEVNISLESGNPSETRDSGVSQDSSSRKWLPSRWGRMLFPSPLFVAPIALPMIMLGIGLGLGLRAPLQLLDLTVGNALRAAGRVLGLRKPKSESPSAGDPLVELDAARNMASENLETTPYNSEVAAVLVTSGRDEDRMFRVSDKPATIGSDESCEIRLPATAGIAEKHARLWWRDGRLMLHHLAPNLVTFVGGRQITWTSVEDGDEALIGPYTLRIAVGQQETETSEVQTGVMEGQEETAPGEYSLGLPPERRQLAHAG